MTASRLSAPPLPDADCDALFLDFDGTLVEIASRPDAIQVADGLPDLLLQARAALSGCLVIVSGRDLADLDRHLGADAMSFAAGVHGMELRGAPAPGPAPDLHRALARARLLVSGAMPEGTLVEDKGKALALHYRGAPDRADEVLALARSACDASDGLLAVQPGKAVAEIKPAAADKGHAVRAFLAEPQFHNRRAVFVGDDLTDEAGFAACAAAGGHGILVGPDRDTQARYALPDVPSVLAWLGALADKEEQGTWRKSI